MLSLDAAVDLTRTGDLWLFRGSSAADRAIRVTTNSPVNHVGMAVVLEDLPPLMWHAELGKSLTDLWTGTHQRGVQLHDLRDAVTVWGTRYGQRAWLRQLDKPVTAEMEDAVLRTVARLDGTPFPSTARLASRWLSGRVPSMPRGWSALRDQLRDLGGGRDRDSGLGRDGGNQGGSRGHGGGDQSGGRARDRGRDGDGGGVGQEPAQERLESAYCAEVVAVTYEEMGLLPGGRRPNWYDPGRFWSGDDLELRPGYQLTGEIPVSVP